MSQNKSGKKALGKVLVVGGCGFLGSHVVEQLLHEWTTSEITVLDCQIERNRFDSVSYIKGDIASRELVQSTLQSVRPEVIIHCASPLATKGTHEAFQSANIAGTRNLLECAIHCGTVHVFVYASSSGIVHDTVTPLVDADESLPLVHVPEQKDFYLQTKAVAEEMVLAANGKNNIYTAAIRPATLFGERDGQLIPTVIERAKEGKAKIQIGNGLNMFDITYVGNCAYALLLAADALLHETAAASEKNRVNGEAFVVTNGEPIPFWEFNRMISRAAGYPVAEKDIKVLPRSVALAIAIISELLYWIFTFGTKKPQLSSTTVRIVTMTRTFNIDKIKQRLGYKARVSLEDGIQRGVAWYLQTQVEPNK